MHWLTQPGTSVPEETRVSVLACQDLREIPGVRNCGSHIGQAFLADEVYGVDFGENWISVSPDVDYDETLEEVHETVESYPGLYRDVQTYLRERIKEVLTGTSESIVVRIYGPDLETLQEQAKEIEEKLVGIDGSDRRPRVASRPTCRTSRWSRTWPRPGGTGSPRATSGGRPRP